MHMIKERIDESANRAVLELAQNEIRERNGVITKYDGVGHQSSLVNTLPTPTRTYSDTDARSPVCFKKGNRRCVKLGHLIECEIHRGKYHSRIHECVSCAEACAREAKAAKKDHGSYDAEDKNKQQQKSKKSGKIKGTHEKTMKQLRKEKREQKRKSSSD